MATRTEHKKLTPRKVALGILFAIGFCIFMYPFVNNWYYQHVANNAIDEYSQAVVQEPELDSEALFAQVRSYNKELVGQTVPDVFAIREGTTDTEYESYLNVLGNGMMGIIDIPVIGVHLPIYHYSTEDSLQKGCGHIFGSSLPVGGKSSHAVITAHRGLPTAEMFSNLDQVLVGDKFFLRVLDRTLAYEVDQVEVVKPHVTRSLAIERGHDLVTLVTCTPYGVNTDRLLVRGHRVPYVPEDEVVSGIRPFGFLMKIAVAGAGVLAALIVLWVLSRVRKRRARAAASASASTAAKGAHYRE